MRNNTSGIYMISFRDISATQSNLFKSFFPEFAAESLYCAAGGPRYFRQHQPFECARTVKTCCGGENPKHI